MPFQPGQSGNPKGAAPGEKQFAKALRVALGDGARLREIAEQLVVAAMAGEQWAVKEVADRLDGKSVQQVDANVTTTTMSHEEFVEHYAKRGTEAGDRGPLDTAH